MISDQKSHSTEPNNYPRQDMVVSNSYLDFVLSSIICQCFMFLAAFLQYHYRKTCTVRRAPEPRLTLDRTFDAWMKNEEPSFDGMPLGGFVSRRRRSMAGSATGFPIITTTLGHCIHCWLWFIDSEKRSQQSNALLHLDQFVVGLLYLP